MICVVEVKRRDIDKSIIRWIFSVTDTQHS